MAKLVTIKEYAELCGVKDATIRLREKNGLIRTIKKKNTVKLINTDLYPPERLREEGAGRKKKNI
jgi:hypothetical protein